MPVGAYGGRARPDAADRARAARSTRPARSAAIRWRWRRAWRCWSWCRRRASTTSSKRSTHALCDGLEAAAREAGVAVHHAARRRHVRPVLQRREGRHLRAGDRLRHRRVQPLLPRDARARRVPRAVGVRGRLHVQRARRRGDRQSPSPPRARRSRQRPPHDRGLPASCSIWTTCWHATTMRRACGCSPSAAASTRRAVEAALFDSGLEHDADRGRYDAQAQADALAHRLGVAGHARRLHRGARGLDDAGPRRHAGPGRAGGTAHAASPSSPTTACWLRDHLDAHVPAAGAAVLRTRVFCSARVRYRQAGSGDLPPLPRTPGTGARVGAVRRRQGRERRRRARRAGCTAHHLPRRRRPARGAARSFDLLEDRVACALKPSPSTPAAKPTAKPARSRRRSTSPPRSSTARPANASPATNTSARAIRPTTACATRSPRWKAARPR